MCSHYQGIQRPESYREIFKAEPPAAPGKEDMWPCYQGCFIRRHPHADVGDEDAYAAAYGTPAQAMQLQRYADAAVAATQAGLGLNAGHDLNRDNLPAFVAAVKGLQEVSIGHAFMADALEMGYAATVQAYLACLNP